MGKHPLTNVNYMKELLKNFSFALQFFKCFFFVGYQRSIATKFVFGLFGFCFQVCFFLLGSILSELDGDSTFMYFFKILLFKLLANNYYDKQ